MKHRIKSTLLILIAGQAAVLHLAPLRAEESPRGGAPQQLLAVPIEAYLKHREALALSEEQVREISRIADGLRAPGEQLRDRLQERTRALQEALAQPTVDADEAARRFQALLQVENEMKALQFRSRLQVRMMLQPGQFEKLRSLAAREPRAGRDHPEPLREKLNQARQEVRRRVGSGEPPRELVEKFEGIERLAKEGRVEEAGAQLDAIVQHLRGEGTQRGGQERMEKPDGHLRRIAEAAKRTEIPEQRQRLEQAAAKLHEALQARQPEKVREILRETEPLVRKIEEGRK